MREGIRLETGYTFSDWHTARQVFQIEVYQNSHYHVKTGQLVKTLRLSDDSAYWRLTHSSHYKRLRKEHNHLMATDPDYCEVFNRATAPGLNRLEEIRSIEEEIRELEREKKELVDGQK